VHCGNGLDAGFNPYQSTDKIRSPNLGSDMRRREFITLLGGAAAAWPLAAHAQQAERVRHVGVLMATSEDDKNEQLTTTDFINALKGAGWLPGKNIQIETRWAAGDPERLRKNAKEMAALAPDVIVAKGAAVPTIAEETKSIPIVFTVFSDMLAQGYVRNFAHPDRNVTGFTSDEIALVSKRVEILKEVSPTLKRVLYIRGARPEARFLFERLTENATRLDVGVTECAATNEADLTEAIAAFARDRDGGLSAGFDVFNVVHRAKIAELAAFYRLPAVYFARFFVEENGGLIAYGPNQPRQFKEAAQYVDRILRGEKIGNLPVQAPTQYDLAVNLKTATALGLTIPATVLARADEVIE
jgi:putative tryptophan/tyrosine transport system substrate-binding protein